MKQTLQSNLDNLLLDANLTYSNTLLTYPRIELLFPSDMNPARMKPCLQILLHYDLLCINGQCYIYLVNVQCHIYLVRNYFPRNNPEVRKTIKITSWSSEIKSQRMLPYPLNGQFHLVWPILEVFKKLQCMQVRFTC